MIEREWEELAGQIVARHMPNEVLSFQVGAPPIIADLIAGREPAKAWASGGLFSVHPSQRGRAEFIATALGDAHPSP